MLMERDLVTVERQDLEEVLGLLVDYLDLPEVWGDTIARFEEALGMTLAQVKLRRLVDVETSTVLEEGITECEC